MQELDRRARVLQCDARYRSHRCHGAEDAPPAHTHHPPPSHVKTALPPRRARRRGPGCAASGTRHGTVRRPQYRARAPSPAHSGRRARPPAASRIACALTGCHALRTATWRRTPSGAPRTARPCEGLSWKKKRGARIRCTNKCPSRLEFRKGVWAPEIPWSDGCRAAGCKRLAGARAAACARRRAQQRSGPHRGPGGGRGARGQRRGGRGERGGCGRGRRSGGGRAGGRGGTGRSGSAGARAASDSLACQVVDRQAAAGGGRLRRRRWARPGAPSRAPPAAGGSTLGCAPLDTDARAPLDTEARAPLDTEARGRAPRRVRVPRAGAQTHMRAWAYAACPGRKQRMCGCVLARTRARVRVLRVGLHCVLCAVHHLSRGLQQQRRPQGTGVGVRACAHACARGMRACARARQCLRAWGIACARVHASASTCKTRAHASKHARCPHRAQVTGISSRFWGRHVCARVHS